MRVQDNMIIPEGAKTLEQVMMIHPCDIGDEVIIKEVRSTGYDSYFRQDQKKKRAKCISIHKWFINFHDGRKTICINKNDIALGAVTIEKAR